MKVQSYLKVASQAKSGGARFKSLVYGDSWDRFVEEWAPIVYVFLREALGPYGKEPHPVIRAMSEGEHAAGANASYSPLDGSITLCPSVTRGKPGITLEKLCHEMVHASLDGFPEGDSFTEEGIVDYSVWTLAHAPVWGKYQEEMIKAAAFNIENRRHRALSTGTEYDAKRWAGGLYIASKYGPYIIFRLKEKKRRGDLTWW